MPIDYKEAYYYLKIINKHTKQSDKEEINKKLISLKKHLSQDESTDADIVADKWRVKETEISIKALRGIKETYDIVNKNIL